MPTTKRKPATVGEILVEEFMQPMGLTQAALAAAIGVQGKHVNELCNNRQNVTAATALILARLFGDSPDFWLNVQRCSDPVGGDEQSPLSTSGSNARDHSVPQPDLWDPGRKGCSGLEIGRSAPGDFARCRGNVPIARQHWLAFSRTIF
jgi:antitoxin HigA-1